MPRRWSARRRGRRKVGVVPEGVGDVIQVSQGIQAAIDSRQGLGGAISIAAGVHDIYEPILFDDNLDIRGENRQATRIRVHGEFAAFMPRKQATASTFRVSFADLRVEHADTTGTERSGRLGIDGRTVSYLTVSRCAFWHLGRGLLHGHAGAVNGGYYVHAQDCEFSLCDTGTWADVSGNAFRVSGGRFWRCGTGSYAFGAKGSHYSSSYERCGVGVELQGPADGCSVERSYFEASDTKDIIFGDETSGCYEAGNFLNGPNSGVLDTGRNWRTFSAAATWDPPAIGVASNANQNFAVPGVRVGDFAMATHAGATQASALITAKAIDAGLVNVRIENRTAAVLDIPDGEVGIVVTRRGA